MTTRYVYSPIYVDALLLRDRDVDANGSLEERIFALQDANYNIIALTDSTGTVIDRMEYKPFGEVTILNDTVDWKHFYQGGRIDETTGLVNFRFRWYSPELGRWTQQDPIHFAAGDINIYRAISNDPLNGLDPSGLADPKVLPTKPVITIGNCGSFIAEIDFKLTKPSQKDGWIVQHVRIVDNIANCNNDEKFESSRIGIKDLEWWEAWYVPSGSYQPSQIVHGLGPNDTIKINPSGGLVGCPGTRGTIVVTLETEYFEGLNAIVMEKDLSKPNGFTKRKVPSASDLPSNRLIQT